MAACKAAFASQLGLSSAVAADPEPVVHLGQRERLLLAAADIWTSYRATMVMYAEGSGWSRRSKFRIQALGKPGKREFGHPLTNLPHPTPPRQSFFSPVRQRRA